MGLWSDGQTIWLTSQFQIWRLENVLPLDELNGGFDRLYVPRIGYTTGDIDAHDIAPDADGRPVFVNTLFGCLAAISERESFCPLWKPPFISKLAAEDRCHLNGLAMSHGVPRYVTACAESDVADGWRDHRRAGGCVIDVGSGHVVARGLSMPHSPRLADQYLWLLDSGNGFLGFINPARGHFERVVFCPGYARGLAIVGNYAVVGLSKPREQTFAGLALDAELQQRGTTSRCGLLVVDLASGTVVHWLRIEGGIDELYDVVALPGVTRPKAFGFKTDEIRRQLWFTDDGEVRHWSAQDRH
jgi:uncharacterized protein (TIGR03032 family)